MAEGCQHGTLQELVKPEYTRPQSMVKTYDRMDLAALRTLGNL